MAMNAMILLNALAQTASQAKHPGAGGTLWHPAVQVLPSRSFPLFQSFPDPKIEKSLDQHLMVGGKMVETISKYLPIGIL